MASKLLVKVMTPRFKIFVITAMIVFGASDHSFGQQQDAQTVLDAIMISSSIFHAQKNGFLDSKLISFNIKNGSKTVIKTIHLHGKLQTPGRTLPWIEADINYSFPGGLEPGEAKHLDLEPNMMSDWNNAEDQWMKTGVLTLTLTSIDDATGSNISRNPPPGK